MDLKILFGEVRKFFVVMSREQLAMALTAVSVIIITVHLIFKPTREKRLKKELTACWKELSAMMRTTNCQPIMLRLAWSDAVTYDSAVRNWPVCGGVNGSIRFDLELNHSANAGLSKAIALLNPIKRRYGAISWADLIQMAGAVAVHTTGGPLIELNYGRVDAPDSLYDDDTSMRVVGGSGSSSKFHRRSFGSSPFKSSRLPVLPCAFAPYPDGAPSADVHLRNVFYRLGLNNRDTVALCGAHTLGRAFKDRSGVCPYSSGDQGATIYTRPTAVAKASGEAGIGMAGGCSWTRLWLQFDNSYFHRGCPPFAGVAAAVGAESPKGTAQPPDDGNDAQLLWLPTDQALFESPEYRPHFAEYAADQAAFFRDFGAAYRKLSELGAKFRFVVRLDGDDNRGDTR